MTEEVNKDDTNNLTSTLEIRLGKMMVQLCGLAVDFHAVPPLLPVLVEHQRMVIAATQTTEPTPCNTVRLPQQTIMQTVYRRNFPQNDAKRVDIG